jgi:hypothetical protein
MAALARGQRYSHHSKKGEHHHGCNYTLGDWKEKGGAGNLLAGGFGRNNSAGFGSNLGLDLGGSGKALPFPAHRYHVSVSVPQHSNQRPAPAWAGENRLPWGRQAMAGGLWGHRQGLLRGNHMTKAMALANTHLGRIRKGTAFPRPRKPRFRKSPAALQPKASACLGGREAPARSGAGRRPLGPPSGIAGTLPHDRGNGLGQNRPARALCT